MPECSNCWLDTADPFWSKAWGETSWSCLRSCSSLTSHSVAAEARSCLRVLRVGQATAINEQELPAPEVLWAMAQSARHPEALTKQANQHRCRSNVLCCSMFGAFLGELFRSAPRVPSLRPGLQAPPFLPRSAGERRPGLGRKRDERDSECAQGLGWQAWPDPKFSAMPAPIFFFRLLPILYIHCLGQLGNSKKVHSIAFSPLGFRSQHARHASNSRGPVPCGRVKYTHPLGPSMDTLDGCGHSPKGSTNFVRVALKLERANSVVRLNFLHVRPGNFEGRWQVPVVSFCCKDSECSAEDSFRPLWPWCQPAGDRCGDWSASMRISLQAAFAAGANLNFKGHWDALGTLKAHLRPQQGCLGSLLPLSRTQVQLGPSFAASCSMAPEQWSPLGPDPRREMGITRHPETQPA